MAHQAPRPPGSSALPVVVSDIEASAPSPATSLLPSAVNGHLTTASAARAQHRLSASPIVQSPLQHQISQAPPSHPPPVTTAASHYQHSQSPHYPPQQHHYSGLRTAAPMSQSPQLSQPARGPDPRIAKPVIKDPPARRPAVVNNRQGQGSSGFPSPVVDHARDTVNFEAHRMRLTQVLLESSPAATRRVVRDNYDACLMGTEFHQAFVLNASIHRATPAITRRAMRDFGAQLVNSAKLEILQHFTQNDFDECAGIILDKLSPSFLDYALAKRLETIEAKPLINALARAERLGYEPGDIVEEIYHQGQGQERVIPQPEGYIHDPQQRAPSVASSGHVSAQVGLGINDGRAAATAAAASTSIPVTHKVQTPAKPQTVASSSSSAVSPLIATYDPFAHLSRDQYKAMHSELQQAEIKYKTRVDLANKIPDENERRIKLHSLKNSNNTKQSNIRKRYGVRLRDRRTAAALQEERARIGLPDGARVPPSRTTKDPATSSSTSSKWAAANMPKEAGSAGNGDTADRNTGAAKRQKLDDGGAATAAQGTEDPSIGSSSSSGGGGGGGDLKHKAPTLAREAADDVTMSDAATESRSTPSHVYEQSEARADVFVATGLRDEVTAGKDGDSTDDDDVSEDGAGKDDSSRRENRAVNASGKGTDEADYGGEDDDTSDDDDIPARLPAAVRETLTPGRPGSSHT